METGPTEELRRRLAFAEAITRATPDCLYIYDMVDDEFRYHNMSVQEFLGYTPEMLSEIEGDFYRHVGHPDEYDGAMAAMQAQRNLAEGEVYDHRHRLRHADGTYRWYSLRVTAFTSNPDGSPHEVLGLLRDVHEAVVSRERLTEVELRFRKLFDRSPAGIALIADDGLFVEVNDALCAFLEMDRSTLIGRSYDSVVHPEDRRATREARRRYSEGSDSETFRAERRFVRPDGTVCWGRLSVTRVVDQSYDVNLVSVEDVTATKEIEARLRHAAMHDSLTGLPNRRLLIDRLDHALSVRHRSFRPLAVFFVDLDRVKQVNDRLGHEAGDELLITVSRNLEVAMRRTDTVSRVGGDEFVIICPELDSNIEVPALASRILDAVRISYPDTDGESLCTSGSIGVALASHVLDNPNALISAADHAMYEAKRSGRDRFVVADDACSTPATPSPVDA